MAEGEPVFTAVAEGNRGPMAYFVANRCHTPGYGGSAGCVRC